MHLALRVSELLSQIIQALQKGDLAACARVCKAWFIPSIEILWSEAIDLPMMLGLLGPIQFDDSNMTSEFSQGITRLQWDRLYLYTKEIQSLKLDTWKIIRHTADYGIPSQALEILTSPQHSEGGPLFPQLQTLRFSFDSDNSGQAALIFFDQPRLASIDIDLAREVPAAPPAPLALALSGVGPRLTTLSISCIMKDENYGWLIPIIPSFDALETLTLRGQHQITTQLIDALSRLPQLRTLNVLVFLHGRSTPVLFTENAFPRLKHLLMWNQWTDSLTDACVDSPAFPPGTLRSLRGTFASGGFPAMMTRFVESKSRIKNLQVRFNLKRATHMPDIGSILELMSNLRHIETLEFRTNPSGFVVTDREIMILARGLPELRELALNNYEVAGIYITTPAPTLLSLRALLVYCPHIEKIAFGIDASSTPATNAIQLSSADSRGPVSLRFFASLLGDPNATAIWLKPCCARFSRVNIEGLGDEETKWQNVEDLLNSA